MKKKIICFDLDNVLCKTSNNDYKKANLKKNINTQINCIKMVFILKYSLPGVWEEIMII